MTEQVNRLVSPDRGRSKNAALPSTSQVTCSRLDVEGMDLQRTSSRELGNSLQVVIGMSIFSLPSMKEVGISFVLSMVEGSWIYNIYMSFVGIGKHNRTAQVNLNVVI